MALIIVLVVVLLLYAFGRYLVHSLGWPRSVDDAAKWGAALLVVALLITGLPELVEREASQLGLVPAVDLGQLLVVLMVTGLGVLGFIAWQRGSSDTKNRAEPRLPPRRRALPPAPAAEDAADEGALNFIEPTEGD